MTETQTVLNGRYALREEIARGGMASVFVADDLRLGRTVAVKVLTREEAARPRSVERFRREAQAAAALAHPNVVGVYDWGCVDDTAFLVMEYVDGPNLRHLVREHGPLDEAAAVRLTAGVAAALEVAHAHGIVHRDVKPRNVLVDRQGSARLADFGIAASSEDALDDTQVIFGTALYMSPEQAQGRTVDGRSDLYSLGVLLYELLTGEPPFRGASPAAVAVQHVHARPVPPREIRPALSKHIEQVVLRALEKEPARRYQSAGEMRRALLGEMAAPGARWLSRLAHPPSPTRLARAPDRRWSPRVARGRRWAVLGVPLLAVAALALSGFALAGVPNVAGASLDQARQAAQDAGLTLQIDEQPTQETPAGVVVTQAPGPGGRAVRGSAIHAVVSSGVRVPDLSGRQCAQARADLDAHGWTVRPVRWRIANIEDFGKIVAQDPAPNDVVPRQAQISVQVAGPVRQC